MDFLRVPTTDPTAIYRHRDGIYAGDLLIAAVAGLDLFTHLAAEPSDKTAICRHFGIKDRPTDVMLTLLRAMELLELDGDAFRPTAIAREHLVEGSPWFVGPYYAALLDRAVCREFLDILRTDAVASWSGTTGGPDWHTAMLDAEFADRFTAAMDSRGAFLAPALARSLELAAYGHVLDVAGGSGIYACALLAKHPHLHATVLEKPPVDAVAARSIAAKGGTDRIATLGIDIFTTRWPTHADVHLLSNVVHDWGETAIAELLARSFEALPTRGMVVIHDAFLNAEKSGPLSVAAYSALLMHSTQGRCYSALEIQCALEQAGFVACEYRATAADRGRIVARKSA